MFEFWVKSGHLSAELRDSLATTTKKSSFLTPTCPRLQALGAQAPFVASNHLLLLFNSFSVQSVFVADCQSFGDSGHPVPWPFVLHFNLLQALVLNHDPFAVHKDHPRASCCCCQYPHVCNTSSVAPGSGSPGQASVQNKLQC